MQLFKALNTGDFMRKFLAILGICIVVCVNLGAQSLLESSADSVKSLESKQDSSKATKPQNKDSINAKDFKLSPSFNCAKAKSKVEKIVCSDNELKALDSMMAKEYRDTRQSLANDWDKKKLLANQRAWIKKYQHCNTKECVKQKLESRLKALEWEGAYSYSFSMSDDEARENGYESGYSNMGLVIIDSCENGICKLSYEGDWGYAHNMCELEAKLIYSNQTSALLENIISDNEVFKKCKISVKRESNGIIFSKEDKTFSSECYAMCGLNALFQWGKVYKKEAQ